MWKKTTSKYIDADLWRRFHKIQLIHSAGKSAAFDTIEKLSLDAGKNAKNMLKAIIRRW